MKTRNGKPVLTRLFSYTVLLLPLFLFLLEGVALCQWNIQDVDAPRSFHASSVKLAVINTVVNLYIAYGDDHLYYLHWNGTRWNFEVVDSSRGGGVYPSLALNSSNHPAVSYYDSIHQDLKYAEWDGARWKIETVDSAGSVGWYTALVIDAAGRPCISYYDLTNGDLKYAKRNGAVWEIETVDSAGDVGQYTSLVFDGSGFPLISYYDVSNTNLKFARWNGASWQVETVDGSGDVGRYSSIGLLKFGKILITYYDATNGDLRAARWTGSAWQIEIVDTAGDVGLYTSLGIENSQLDASVSYYDRTNGILKYAYNNAGLWYTMTVDSAADTGLYTSIVPGQTTKRPYLTYLDLSDYSLKLAQSTDLITWSFQELDHGGNVGQYTSAAYDSQGRPRISYYDVANRCLKFASWDGISWSLASIDCDAEVGFFSSLDLDPSGYPAISYYDMTNGDLKFARFDGNTWNRETVDQDGNQGQYCSLAFDPFGNPGISYYDADHPGLKLAQWDGLWRVDRLDHSASVGKHTSLDFDQNGYWFISYYDTGHGNLKIQAGSGITDTVDTTGNVGWYSSIACDPTGKHGISYYDVGNRDLKYAYGDGRNYAIQVVDSGGDVGAFSSLAMNPEGRPAIAYFDWTNLDLKYARWDGTSWKIEIVDSIGDVGSYASLAFDPTGNPGISYYDRTNGYLKFAAYPYLRYAHYVLEADLCPFGSPPGVDGRVNPGETIQLRIYARNASDFIDYSMVRATIEAVTPGVTPPTATVDFGVLTRGQTLGHIGAPIAFNVPVWLDCGGSVLFRIYLSSTETGELRPQYITIPVDGDPANCKCRGNLPDLIYDSFALEADRCQYTRPPGSDGRVNPGESIDLRLSLRNQSPVMAYTSVTGKVVPLTPGVTPALTLLTFGTLLPGQTVPHSGNPLTLDIPLTLTCGDVVVFALTLSSSETGQLAPQYFTVNVNGDLDICRCENPYPPLRQQAFRVEADRCLFSSPPGGDSRINPGEEVDFRLAVKNYSPQDDLHDVTARVDAVTPGIVPSRATVVFGTVPAWQTVSQSGDPLTLKFPLSLKCGDMLYFRVTYSSTETGALPAEIISMPVDGDPSSCRCTPVDLFYESYSLEDDRCAYSSPPGSNGLVNPGEDVDLRIVVKNYSDTTDLTNVTADVEALTPDVTPATATLDFGMVLVGEAAPHLGDPLTVHIPDSLTCGDEVQFLITLYSTETGTIPFQFFSVPVNGDPAGCNCEEHLSLHYDSFRLEADRCSVSSPPGGDGRVNPGESVDLRIAAVNRSLATELHAVTGTVEALTAGVSPVFFNLDFGVIPLGAAVSHAGDPLTVSVPLSVTCGDALSFRITLSSAETGGLPPETFVVPVDGDPANCNCLAAPPPKVHRGIVAQLIPGWQAQALPLSSGNDNETAPFPIPVTVPGTVADDLQSNEPLILYRFLTPDENPADGVRLLTVKTAVGTEIHVR